MEPTAEQQQGQTRSVDVTGLSEEAVRAVEHVVNAFRGQRERPAFGGTTKFSSYEEWKREFDAWMGEVRARAHLYPPGFVADDSREAIYSDDRDE